MKLPNASSTQVLGVLGHLWKKIRCLAVPTRCQPSAASKRPDRCSGLAHTAFPGALPGQMMGSPAVDMPHAPPRGGILARLVPMGLVLILPVGVGLAPMPMPMRAAEESLRQSHEQLGQFPFQPNCGGNTQEMVACLWQRRNQADTVLAGLLATAELLEEWRASRRRVCGRVARKAEGGSIHPIVWLSCENALNQELLRQLQRPLFKSADL